VVASTLGFRVIGSFLMKKYSRFSFLLLQSVFFSSLISTAVTANRYELGWAA